MNLNQYDRQAFVKAVMDDVPDVDYDEPAQKLARQTIESLLPPAIRALSKADREYLECNHYMMPGRLSNFYHVGHGGRMIEVQAPDVWKELVALEKLSREQDSTRAALRGHLTQVIGACRTLKQARERLPEFEKYLPTERSNGSGLTNLPVANLVAELTAAGWPKQEG